jgi:hypothetical protein
VLGGRKPPVKRDEQLMEALLALVEPTERGAESAQGISP